MLLTMIFFVAFSIPASADEVGPETWEDPNTPYAIDDDFCRPVNSRHYQKSCTDGNYQIYFVDGTRVEGEEFTEFYFSTSGGYTRKLYACASGTIQSVNSIPNMLELQYYDDSGYEYTFQYLMSFYGEDGDSSVTYSVAEGDSVQMGDEIGEIHFGNNIQEVQLWFGILDVNALYYLPWSEFFEIDGDDSDIYGEEINLSNWYDDYFTEEIKGLWDEILELLKGLLAPQGGEFIKNIYQAMLDVLYGQVTTAWNSMADMLGDETLLNAYQTVTSENMILVLTVRVATSLVLLLFIFEIVRRLMYDNDFITNPKECVIFLVFLSLTFTLVSNAAKICRMVISTNATLASKIAAGTQEYNILPIKISDYGSSDSTLFISFEKFILQNDFLANTRAAFAALVLFSILIIVFVVQIKLLLRQLELAGMLIVSPIFFACVIFKSARSYFTNFIKEFITLTMETVYMAIIFRIGALMFNSQFEGATSIESTDTVMIFKLFALIAISLVMIKIPESLKECVPNFKENV